MRVVQPAVRQPRSAPAPARCVPCLEERTTQVKGHLVPGPELVLPPRSEARSVVTDVAAVSEVDC
eukprot:3803609-Karenia_brevis.AAC.1